MSPRGRRDSLARLALVAILALLLLAPGALAHVDNARPISQTTQNLRTVVMEPDGVGVDVTLLKIGEPTRDWVRHTLDPSRGSFTSEHRPDAASSERRFLARWEITRIVEFRDLNHDGRYQPGSDTVAKSWPLAAYPWRIASPVNRVSVGGVSGYDVVWEGNLTGAPALRLEAVAAGNDFTDEGAYTRPQDVLLYLDVRSIPARSIGSLFAIEGSVTMPAGASTELVILEDYTTGVWSYGQGRHALLIWGGEALLDGRERRVEATLGAPEPRDGNETRSLILHLPTTDTSMRFVIIQGLEYDFVNKRAPLPATIVMIALVVVVALWTRSKK